MNGRHWKPDEDEILKAHLQQGPEAVQAQLAAAGFTRSLRSVKARASLHEIRSGMNASPTPIPLEMLPIRPVAVTARLHALAESRPTLAEYERRKAEILKGEA